MICIGGQSGIPPCNPAESSRDYSLAELGDTGGSGSCRKGMVLVDPVIDDCAGPPGSAVNCVSD
jgi:hypothetical protein